MGVAAVTRPDAPDAREDPLDRYRREVEQILGDEVSLAGDDDFEALFEHVTSCFERAVDAETCARTWRLHRAVLGA
jgi:hypothetical protein